MLVTGGVHGNEPAGARAARQIRHWPITRGRLIVIPRCNVPGLKADERLMSGQPEELDNLNRNFPTRGKSETARGPLATALWAFVSERQPDYVLDLHEGYGFRSCGSDSTGSSIIRTRRQGNKELQNLMLEAVNGSEPEHEFARLQGAAKGSLVSACSERLGARAFMCETTYKHQPLALRTRQHRIMVHALLEHLGMAAVGRNRMVPAANPDAGTVRAALYDGPGTSTDRAVRRVEDIMVSDKGIVLRRVAPADIREVALEQFDIVIFGGGSGHKQAEGLREPGREAVRRFVQRGGGYVGVCAGAYLATSNYTWSLDLLDADSIDRKHWRRGKGQVEIELTPRGREFFRSEGPAVFKIHFQNGPILARAGAHDLPPYEVLARYRTGIGEGGADPETMVDTPAIVIGRFGKGRAMAFSPHPDKTEGLHEVLIRAVREVGRLQEASSVEPAKRRRKGGSGLLRGDGSGDNRGHVVGQRAISR
ncbi:MAG: BPL-N domain-containing protein [Pirellulaceae bacterium]